MKRQHERREVAVYDGQNHLGRIVIQRRKFTAFSVKGARLGNFDDQKSATHAVIDATKCADQAQNWLLARVAYTTGLPEHFLASARDQRPAAK
jgi:hypothetical protein